MRRAYLLVYSMTLGTREVVRKWADESNQVITWRYDLPYAIYLISEASASELAADLESVLGPRGRYIIIEASDNRQGRLPAESWHLLRHKRHKPK